MQPIRRRKRNSQPGSSAESQSWSANGSGLMFRFISDRWSNASEYQEVLLEKFIVVLNNSTWLQRSRFPFHFYVREERFRQFFTSNRSNQLGNFTSVYKICQNVSGRFKCKSKLLVNQCCEMQKQVNMESQDLWWKLPPVIYAWVRTKRNLACGRIFWFGTFRECSLEPLTQ